MADHDNHRERFLTLMEGLVGAYVYIQALLADLPLPIAVPDFEPVDEEEDGPVTALLSLNRVRQLIEDEPIEVKIQRAYEHLVLDWLTAYELLVITRLAGPAPWRLDAVEFSINRVVTWIELIEGDDADES
ncbi:hypothetical protein [Streptomyces sp. GbtcB6]|uniref:hypothetical protein n=1 Tax=Streptomyces sp. GbtcB6 TaxID=2824751 RepID=UPI001C2FC516|nr:hypothetical protein [Streptomyces sp. GbtcB6]